MHPSNCIIYCRVSTTKQSTNNESLNDQIEACQRLAKERDWSVIGIYPESFSGRERSRPAYDQIISFLVENPGVVNFLVVRVLDRFTRGGSGDYLQMKTQLRSLGVELVDSYGVVQPSKNVLDHLGFEYEWSRTSPSEIAEVVVSTADKQEVQRILKRTIEAEIRLTQAGFKIRGANDGYINKKVIVEGKRRTIMVPDPERSKYFIKMFEMRAALRYTDQEIVNEVNAMGYRSKRFNRWNKEKTEVIGQTKAKPLSIKALQKFIQKTAYAGVICEKWTHDKPIKSRSEALVSIETYNKANRGKKQINENADGTLEFVYDIEKPSRAHQKIRPEFAYKFIRCPKCGNMLKGSSSRGKSGKYYPAYHCSRGHKRFSVRPDVMDEKVLKFITSLQMPEHSWACIEKEILELYDDYILDLLEIEKDKSQQLTKLKQKQGQTLEALVLSPNNKTRELLDAEIQRLDDEMKSLRHNSIPDFSLERQDIHDVLMFVKYEVEHPEKSLLDKVNPIKQEAYFHLLFTEPPTYEDLESGTPNLSLIFNRKLGLSPSKIEGDNRLAALRRLKWNTWNVVLKLFRKITLGIYTDYKGKDWVEIGGNMYRLDKIKKSRRYRIAA